MSSRLDPMAWTHTTPTEATIHRLASEGRLPVSIAFYLAKYRGMDIDKALQKAEEIRERPDLTAFFAMGRNFSQP